MPCGHWGYNAETAAILSQPAPRGHRGARGPEALEQRAGGGARRGRAQRPRRAGLRVPGAPSWLLRCFSSPEPGRVREGCTLAGSRFRGRFSRQQFRAPGGKVPVSRVQMGGQHANLAAPGGAVPEASLGG